MKTETKKKARGGLAAAAKAAEPKEKKPSKCAFIDALYIQGGHTQAQILELTLAAFPKATKKATLSTVRARPAHIRKAGKTPKWEKEPAETAKA